ncbi:MAG: hypothetical protein KAI99_04105, partial [Cyclobacteriaceae bacterium]|nr:hypothetical protein [Cyclobacteriaceae bacterium]
MKSLFLVTIYLTLSFPGNCQIWDLFNNPPTINDIPDYQPIPENAGSQTITLTGISDGDNNKVQKVTITASSDNNDLISNLQVEYDQGTTAVLTFASKLNVNGKAIITIRLDDGQLFRNITERSFDVTVFAVNSKPSFQLSSNLILIDANEGKVEMKKFVTNIDDGDPELKQNLNFIITTKSVTGNLTFKSFPEIDVKSGDLIFEIKKDRFGEATIAVLLKDNGGTENGGIDISDESIFIIKINIINDPPTLNDIPTPITIFEDAGEQFVELNGISSGTNENQEL